MKQKVLFVCIHNSARSQMAEAYLNHLCGDDFTAQSAGLEPGTMNPLVVEVMQEEGIDLSRKPTRSVDEVLKRGDRFDCVITVCDETSAERCPVIDVEARRLHWGFPDPSRFTGSHAEKLAQTRAVREAIRRKIQSWCGQMTGAVCRC